MGDDERWSRPPSELDRLVHEVGAIANRLSTACPSSGYLDGPSVAGWIREVATTHGVARAIAIARRIHASNDGMTRSKLAELVRESEPQQVPVNLPAQPAGFGAATHVAATTAPALPARRPSDYSTGPVTQAGKDAVSLNAAQHRLRSRGKALSLMPGTKKLQQELAKDLPGTLERVLLGQVASELMRLQLADACEAELLADGASQTNARSADGQVPDEFWREEAERRGLTVPEVLQQVREERARGQRIETEHHWHSPAVQARASGFEQRGETVMLASRYRTAAVNRLGALLAMLPPTTLAERPPFSSPARVAAAPRP